MVRESASQDLRFSQAEDAFRQPLVLLSFSPKLTLDRRVRATETGSVERKHFVEMHCFVRGISTLFFGGKYYF